MSKNKGVIGVGLILAIVLGIAIVGGGAYYLGKNSFKKEVNNKENLPDTYSGDNIKLLSFKVVNGNFVVETDYFNEKASIKVFADPTGTGIGELDPMTTGAFLGTMIPDLNGENVKWTLSGDNFKDKITNHLYVVLYLDGKASASVNFPGVEGVFGYESIFGEPLKNISTVLPRYIGTHSDCGGLSSCWPPTIITSSKLYFCNNIGVAPNTEGNDITEQRVINGRKYCIHSLSEGYAGGRGYTYTYTTSNGSGTKMATFGLTYQSCGVWQGDGTSKYSDCKNNQSNFSTNLDNLIDSLMQS
jgi:hypothetical protein